MQQVIKHIDMFIIKSFEKECLTVKHTVSQTIVTPTHTQTDTDTHTHTHTHAHTRSHERKQT